MKYLIGLGILLSCAVARAGSESKSLLRDEPYQRGVFSQKLDVFVPARGEGPFWPVIVLHGGCFQGGSKSGEDTKEYIARLTGAGFAAVSVEYRQVEAATRKNIYPAAMEDVQDAVRWLRLNGAKYKMRTDKIVAFGFSAGATLAAYLGTRRVLGSDSRDDQLAMDDELFSSRVSAVVGFFGRMDFTKSRRDREPVDPREGRDCGEHFVGESRRDGDLSTAFLKADVISQADDKAARFLLGHGTKDSAVSIEHSEMLMAKLSQVGGARKDTIFRIVGADHGFSKPGEMDLAWTYVSEFLNEIFYHTAPVQAVER